MLNALTPIMVFLAEGEEEECVRIGPCRKAAFILCTVVTMAHGDVCMILGVLLGVLRIMGFMDSCLNRPADQGHEARLRKLQHGRPTWYGV